MASFKSGFVSLFGRPNAGKSTLLNAMVGEKLAIVSPKIQTTRHRIRAFLNGEDFQVIFSDTPGIIEPEYRLHVKMMQAVRSSLEDADLALLLVDIQEDWDRSHQVFADLRLKVPTLLLINKIDKASDKKKKEAVEFFRSKGIYSEILTISASSGLNKEVLLERILKYLPEGEPFFDPQDLTDMPTRFFVAELIREKIYELFSEEIPYHTAVQINAFQEKQTLVKISAEIIVQRESQKAILLGEKGRMIKKLGTEARQSIETFIGSKIFLELFVKVRPKWRDNETHLKEYGYG